MTIFSKELTLVLELNQRTDTMKKVIVSKEEILEDLKRVNQEHGKLTRRLYDKYGTWTVPTITKHGSFNELKAEAIGSDTIHSNNVPKEVLIEDIMMVFEREGKITQELYLEKGNFSRKPILKYFNSWNNMMQELELGINCLINIPDEDLLAEITRLYKEYDALSATIMKHHGKFSVEVYQRRFGSFNHAVELAGLDTRVRGRTSPTANAMIKMIYELIHEEPIPEATADWFVNPETGRKLYVDAFFPAHNLAFEYNGPQHYIPVDHYGGNHNLEYRMKLDKVKEDTLKKNGFNLLVFKYDEPHTREHMIVRLGQIFQQQ